VGEGSLQVDVNDSEGDNETPAFSSGSLATIFHRALPSSENQSMVDGELRNHSNQLKTAIIGSLILRLDRSEEEKPCALVLLCWCC